MLVQNPSTFYKVTTTRGDTVLPARAPYRVSELFMKSVVIRNETRYSQDNKWSQVACLKDSSHVSRKLLLEQPLIRKQ